MIFPIMFPCVVHRIGSGIRRGRVLTLGMFFGVVLTRHSIVYSTLLSLPAGLHSNASVHLCRGLWQIIFFSCGVCTRKGRLGHGVGATAVDVDGWEYRFSVMDIYTPGVR